MKEYREFTDEEKKWIESLQRCMNKAPNTLFMFVGGSNGSMVIYPKDENNDRYMTDGRSAGVDGYAPSVSIKSNIEMDGGDW